MIQLPTWQELPESLFSSQVVSFVNQVLTPLFNDESVLTSTMIQNYTKRSLLPKLEGRKYTRVQIAMLIVLTIYKETLPLSEINLGLGSVLSRTQTQTAYQLFRTSLKQAFDHVFNGNDLPVYSKEDAGIYAIALCFAYKRLASNIIMERTQQKEN